MVRLGLIFATLVLAPVLAAGAPPLGGYNADIKESSISGISSGAFMAVQFGVSWSSIVKGVGIIAGGPYYRAQGTATDGLLGNLGPALTATGPCMKGPPPALEPLIDKTDEWARSGDIDDPHNIVNQPIYIFAGYNDLIVNPKVGEAAYRFYLHYLGGHDPGNLFFQNAIGAGHSQVTIKYGEACNKNEGYFIDHCHYDQAEIILQHIYGARNPKNAGALSGKLLSFYQREMTSPELPASYSMAETGYVYVPAACAAQQRCRVHVALHGCKQNFDTIGDRYIQHAGYNEWADTNRLIILYPQTIGENDYPTSERADYVIGCMAANGNNREALLKCSCAIDTIAGLMPYSDYERAETALSLQLGGGVGGRIGLFRDPPQIKAVIEELRRAQAEANLQCR